MKRLFTIVSALSLSAAFACAEQPGKKKEEDSEKKVETRAVDGSKPAPAKAEETKPGEAK